MRLRTAFLFLMLAAAPAFGQTPPVPSPEAAKTEEVVMRHMHQVLSGDIEGMLKDMTDPLTLIGPTGARVYTHEAFRKQFAPSFANEPRRFKITRTAFSDKIGFVLCTDNPGQKDEYQFAETFFLEQGKIVGYSRMNFLPCPEGACKRSPPPAASPAAK